MSTVPEGFIPDGFEPDAVPVHSSRPKLPPRPMMGPGGPMLQPGYEGGEPDAIKALPFLGGLGGGALGAFGGPVGEVAGIGAGAAGGESLRRKLMGLPQDPKAIALEGGKNAAFGVGGMALGPLLRGAGKAMVRQGYKVTGSLAEKFPEIFKWIDEARIPIGSKEGREGTAATKRIMTGARKAKASAIAADPARYGADQLATNAIENARALAASRGQALTADDELEIMERVALRAEELLSEAGSVMRGARLKVSPKGGGKARMMPQPLSAHELDVVRQRAQAKVSPGYSAAQRGDFKPSVDDDAPLAESARAIQAKNKPLDAAIGEVRKAMALRKGVGRAEVRPEMDMRSSILPLLAGSSAGHFMGGGMGAAEGGLATVALHRLLSSPQAMSRLGFAFDSPAAAAAARYAPRPLATWMFPYQEPAFEEPAPVEESPFLGSQYTGR